MGRNHKPGLAKLKILNRLAEGEVYRSEIRTILEEDPKIGGGKGSYRKDNLKDNHEPDLENWGLMELERDENENRKGPLYKLKEDSPTYPGLKKLYDLYDGTTKDFLSEKFVQYSIDEKLLNESIKKKWVIYALLGEFLYGEPKEELIEYILTDIPKEKLGVLVFPPNEKSKIVDIIKCSPTAFNLVMTSEKNSKLDDKIIRMIIANLNYLSEKYKEEFDSPRLSLINAYRTKLLKKTIPEFLDIIIEKSTNKNTKKSLFSIFRKDEKNGISSISPTMRVFESMFITDFFQDNLHKIDPFNLKNPEYIFDKLLIYRGKPKKKRDIFIDTLKTNMEINESLEEDD